MSLIDLNWYCFRVHSGRELDTVKILHNLNYCAFAPSEKKLRRRNFRSKSRITVETAIFSGYIFMGFAGQPNWRQLWALERRSASCGLTMMRKSPRYHVDENRDVHRIDGDGEPIVPFQDRLLISVVGDAGRPRIADNEQIIKAIQLSSAAVDAPDPLPFEPGQKVEVTAGAFDGFVVEVVDLDEDKARCLMELFGSQREVEISNGDLQAA
ncbi:MAG: transcription termination/antitermination NusG family protein [Pseudomonadota bacterium]